MLEERVPFLEINENINNRRRGYLLNNSLNVDSGPIGLTHIHSGSTTAVSEVNELARADKDVPVPFSRDIPVSVAPLTVHRCEASSPVNSGSQVEALTVVSTNRFGLQVFHGRHLTAFGIRSKRRFYLTIQHRNIDLHRKDSNMFPKQRFVSNTSGFGAFEQQRAPTGTGHIKCEPVVGTDVVVKSGSSKIINVKKHCITCMTEYEGKSLEELRLEDYTAGRKGPTSGGMFTGFQQATENKPLFGGTNKFSFGGNTQNPTTSTDLFGNKFAFGATSITDAFKQQRAPTGTGRIKYEPVVGTDVVVKSGSSNIINVKKHCITCMTEYEGKSLEELRLEDYTAGRKGSTTGGMFTGFQQATENKPLFGGTNKFSFGGNTQNPTTSTDLFGNKFAFGATSTTGTGIFTFGTATPSFDGFGTNTQNQQSTDLFGAKSATTGFGSTPASSSFETGLFNAKPQQTLAPTVGSTAPSAPGTSCTGGTPNDLPPLSFHTVHGKNVRISREENKARRVEWHNEGVTFSARPVRVNEKNEIPTTSTSIQFTEKEQFILSPKPNDNIENKDLSNASEDFCSDDSVKDPDYVEIDTPFSTKRSLLKNKNREVFKNLLSGVDLNEKQYDNFSNDVSTINQTSSPIPMPIAPMQTESSSSSSDGSGSSSSSDGSSSSDSESSSDDQLNNERLTAVVQSRVDNNIFRTRATSIEEDISRNDSIEPEASTSRYTPPTSLELTVDTNSTYLGCNDNISSNKGRKRKSTPNNWLRNKAKNPKKLWALASSIGKNFSKNMDKETLKLGDVKILKVESNDSNYCFSYKTSYEDTEFKTVMIDKIDDASMDVNVDDDEIQKVIRQLKELEKYRPEPQPETVIISDSDSSVTEHEELFEENYPVPSVCVRFIEISDLWLGVIRFGFTNHDPSTLARELLRTACPNLTDKAGSWAKELDEQYCEEDNILSYYVNSVGDVIFGINGEDKGLFFSGVDTTSSLWALIDLYGKCTAVQFLDPRAPNHMRRSTQSPLVDDDIPIGGMRSLSVEEELPPPRYQNPLAPLSLHWTKGRNVHFVNEKGVAARIENEFCQGYVFTARPIHPGQTIVVQILATDSEFAGSLAIGLTSCDPATLGPCDLPDDAEKLLDRPEYWVIRRHVANGLQRGDELAVTLTVDGEVRVSKNWSDPVTDMHVDHTQRLWAFVDLYGETQKIRMLSSHTFPAQIPPQQLRMLAGSAAPITTSAGGSVPVVSLSSQTNGRNLSNNQQGSTLASAHYIEPIQASSQLCVAGYQPIPPQPEEEEERKVSAPGTSSTGDTPNDLPPLSFHRVHSKNMTISQDGFTAHRDKSLMIGVAFSARPVRVNEKVCVRLVEMTNRLFGGIRFGFTTHEDPTTLALALSNTPLIDYTDKPGYWVRELLQQFIELDNILSYYVNSAGDVIFGINGEDKGLLFSGVDTRSPLWALIDLYGNCTAVQFADPRALNQMGRSTQSTLVEDYRLIAPETSCTGGTPNDLPPLSFHEVHGPNVRISQDGSTARCVHSGYGVSFSARPVKVNEKVCVRFVEIITRFKVIGFGFTTHDPTTFPYQSTYSFNTDRPGYWVEQLWKEFYEVDNIFYYYVDSRGVIHFGINGEDKGLFFSGVDTRSPLWALIDLYGDSCYGCSTVQFADPRAPNQMRRSTQRPLLDDDKLLSITVEEEALPTPRFQNPLVPLSLHRTKGRNVRFGNDRGIAARIAEESCQGYVFTARPVHPGQTIVVQILATESEFDESLAIGLTSCDPATLRPRDLPDDSEQLLDRPEYWVFRRDSANDLGRGDELAVTLTVNGEVRVSRNGTDPVTVMHVDHTQRLWAFVDIYGRTKKVKMLISQILPAQTPPQQVLAESAAPIATAAAGTVLDVSLLPQTNGQNLSNHQQGLSLASAHDIEPIQASSQPTPPQTEEKEEVSDDSGECTICYENPVDSVLYTCGHMCMCYSCAVQVWRDKGNGQCPLCRKEIIDVIRTYKS
ncbi:unnamed protein product [Parnassius apollo]|uniref:Nuclear pore complex protein Nup98-Nup96 n=1 Tax=Parnassius apollo TaxID=110799 RepID=A0A8S3Y954_PARAO|nr:unnamed protein product [Parnassius apollo]